MNLREKETAGVQFVFLLGESAEFQQGEKREINSTQTGSSIENAKETQV